MARNYIKNPNPSPVEQALLDILSDGEPHSLRKLSVAMTDREYAERSAIQVQISNLRKLLLPKGRDIVKQILDGGGEFYRMVRLLHSEE